MRFLICLLLFITVGYGINNTNQKVINYGLYLDGVLLSGEKDVRVAINLWLNHFIRLDNKKINVNLYDDLDKLIEDFTQNKTVNIIGFDSISYLERQHLLKNHYQEIFTFANSKEEYVQYYLIANKYRRLAEIKNRILCMKKGDSAARIWIDYLVHKKLNGHKHYTELIKKEITIKKQSQAVLNTFFGKANFAVVTKNVWDTIVKINPKIKSRLNVVEKSPKIFTTSIGLIAKSISKEIVNEFKKSIDEVNHSVKGRQILDLLKVKRVLMVDETYFNKLGLFYNHFLQIESTLNEN